MTLHKNMLNKCKTLLPVLSHNLHKGQMGRIGVIGGCEEYSGAPYYAAISALRTGADLVYVFSFKSAVPVIKSFSPELIVLPFLDSPDCIDLIKPWLEKLHALVVGPGLGNSAIAQDAVRRIFEHISRESNFNNKKMPIIADAESLNVIETETFRNYNGCIYLTPNVHELTKLSSRLIGRQTYEPTVTDVQALLNKLEGNYVIVLKGADDVIANKRGTLVCTEIGSARRCGGQGDILAGSMSTFAYWASKQTHYCDELDPVVLAAYAASSLTRHTNKLAFQAKGRNMITTDVVELLPNAFQTLFVN